MADLHLNDLSELSHMPLP